MHIDQLQLEIKRAIDEAYERGFREGSQSIAASIMQAAQAVTAGILPSDARPAQIVQFDVADCSAATGGTMTIPVRARDMAGDRPQKPKRAPRGLTKTVVHQVLSDGMALPMADVQRRAKEIDGRISEKTVYNELYREPEYWKNGNNRWMLLSEDEAAAVKARQLGMTEAFLKDLNLTDAPDEREEREALTAH